MKVKVSKFTGCSHERLSLNSCQNCPDYQICEFKAYEVKHNKMVERSRMLTAKLTKFLVFTLVVSFILSSIASFDTQEKIMSYKSVAEIRTEEPINLSEKEVTEQTENMGLQETEGEILETEEAQETIESTTELIDETTTIPVTELTVPFQPTILKGYKISPDGPYAQYVYILSEEDMIYIAKVVWAEARGECYEGKVAVAAVVLNRYFSNDPCFDRTSILAIIKQEAQFASISNVTMGDLENVPDCMKAVEDACKGWDPTREVFEKGALYFYNPNDISGWQAEIREGIKVMVIGNHNFHYDFEKVEE